MAYAYFKKLDYFSTECIYSPNAYRGHARTYLKDLEAIRPRAIIGEWVAKVAQFNQVLVGVLVFGIRGVSPTMVGWFIG